MGPLTATSIPLQRVNFAPPAGSLQQTAPVTSGVASPFAAQDKGVGGLQQSTDMLNVLVNLMSMMTQILQMMLGSRPQSAPAPLPAPTSGLNFSGQSAVPAGSTSPLSGQSLIPGGTTSASGLGKPALATSNSVVPGGGLLNSTAPVSTAGSLAPKSATPATPGGAGNAGSGNVVMLTQNAQNAMAGGLGYGVAPTASASKGTGAKSTSANAVGGGYGTTPTNTSKGTQGTGATTGTGTQTAAAKLSKDDFVDYLLAGSKGGTVGTDEAIEGRYARPGSKFANAGANEFDAVIASAYTSQFKAYAMGLDAVYAPGKDINKLADNIATAQNAQFTPEAETLAKVAALYRGDLTGVNKYNNAALGGLLNKWGRQDLASKPGVGVTDVESIGGVVKALNEEKRPEVRQAWLQEIFDFQNNTPVSPSGAVPNAKPYQDAINMVRNGTVERLLNNYNNGIKTQGPIAADAGTGVAGGPNGGGATGGAPEIPNVDFRTLTPQQRTQLGGLNDRERAVLHLWGRQMIAKGHQDGGILLTVMEDLQAGGANGSNSSVKTDGAEAQLARDLIARDQARFGGVTGKSLDEEFFKIMAERFGETDLAQRYGNAPVRFATGAARLPAGTSVDSPEWEARLQQQSGLNGTENAVLRLWGHNPLFTGNIDGAILPFTLQNPNSLDKGLNKGLVQTLLNADLASDGVLNGDSLKSSFKDVLDKVYLGQGGSTVEKINATAQSRAASLGRTAQQIGQSLTTGVQDAMNSVGNLMKEHPVMTGMATMGLGAAMATCPFLAGMGAGAAGIALGQMQSAAKKQGA